MPLPVELLYEDEETTVVGDIDAFMAYVESGQAAKDWQERMTFRYEELDEFVHS